MSLTPCELDRFLDSLVARRGDNPCILTAADPHRRYRVGESGELQRESLTFEQELRAEPSLS